MYDDNRDADDAASSGNWKRRTILGAAAAALGGTFASSGASATPYGGSRHSIPGRIEAEDYDTDGSGIAYNDTTAGNSGGAYRSDGVDIEAGGSGYNVGWTQPGEWLNYSATIDQAGTYEVTARAASGGGGGSFTLEQDQADLATFNVPDTGGWQSWTTVTQQVDLAAGDHMIAVYFDTAGVNLDWLDFSLVDGGGGGGGGGGSGGGGIASGTYKILNVGSDMALDVENASTANGANVQQWTQNTCNCQVWDVQEVSSGVYSVTAAHSGKALDVANVSQDPGANVHQWDYVGGGNQHWRIEDTGDGTYRMLADHSGLALDINNGSTSAGANVLQWTYHGGAGQRFTFEPADGGGGGGSGPDNRYAPYLEVWNTNSVQKVQDSGIDAVHIAFVLGSPSGPTLGNQGAIGTAGWVSKIQQMQDAGVEVRITIGGWDSNTVSAYASSVEQCVGWYEDILDTYGVTHLDIDDENADDRDQRYGLRNDALAELQNRRPEVTVSYTVPANQSGIANMAHSPARDMVSDAIASGVDLEYVNIMTMDFQPTNTNTITNAAAGTHSWLAGQYPNLSAAERWELIGITPMNGIQNQAGPTLTVTEAQNLRNWAQSTDIGMLTIWSLDRDQEGSGIGAAPYAFSDVFNQF